MCRSRYIDTFTETHIHKREAFECTALRGCVCVCERERELEGGEEEKVDR